MGLSDLMGAAKAKLQKRKVSNQIYNTFKGQATPITRAGETNYNTEQGMIRKFANNMDAAGAKKYAKGQYTKYLSQMKGK